MTNRRLALLVQSLDGLRRDESASFIDSFRLSDIFEFGLKNRQSIEFKIRGARHRGVTIRAGVL